MPTNGKSSNKTGTPGLGSLAPTPAKKPVSTTPATKPAPVKKPLEKRVVETREAPKTTTKSNFTVGGSNYNIVDDNNSARKLIKWDDKGNIAEDSPVIVVGKNANGGFILAANENAQGVRSSLFPYTKESGISFPSLASDVEGSTPAMQSVHGGSYDNINDIANAKAASLLRGIYKRTRQL